MSLRIQSFFLSILLLMSSITLHASDKNEIKNFKKSELLLPLPNEFYTDVCPRYLEKGMTDLDVKNLITSYAIENYYSVRGSLTWATIDAGIFLGFSVVNFLIVDQLLNTAPAARENAVVEAPGMHIRYVRSLMAFTGLFVNGFLLTELLKERIKQRGEEITQFVKTSPYISQIFGTQSSEQESAKEPFVRFEILRLQVECRKNDLSEYMKNYFDEAFNTGAMDMFNSYAQNRESSYSGAQESSSFNKFEKAINVVLSLPLKKNKIEINSELKQKLSFLSTYSKEISNEMRKKTIELMMKAADDSSSAHLKSTMYFLGERGVGKTHLVRKYAEAMGLLLVEINIGKELEDMGSNYQSSGSSTLISKLINFEKPSFITGAILKARRLYPHLATANMIFFIDEADKAINSQEGPWSNESRVTGVLLKLLDPSTKNFEFDELGLSYEIDSSLFILAGNKPLKNAALNSRMKMIQFPNLTTDQKMYIVHTEFEKTIKEKKNVRINADLSIKLTHQQEHKDLITEMVKYDKSPGVRSLLLTMHDYVVYLVQVEVNKASPLLFDDVEDEDSFDYKDILEKYSFAEKKNSNIPQDESEVISTHDSIFKALSAVMFQVFENEKSLNLDSSSEDFIDEDGIKNTEDYANYITDYLKEQIKDHKMTAFVVTDDTDEDQKTKLQAYIIASSMVRFGSNKELLSEIKDSFMYNQINSHNESLLKIKLIYDKILEIGKKKDLSLEDIKKVLSLTPKT